MDNRMDTSVNTDMDTDGETMQVPCTIVLTSEPFFFTMVETPQGGGKAGYLRSVAVTPLKAVPREVRP